MDKKTVSQMRKEYHEYYYKEIKPMLKILNRRRLQNTFRVYAWFFTVSGFIIMAAGSALQVNGESLKFLLILGGIFIAAGMLLNVLFCKLNKNAGKVDFTGEDEFKARYMPDILKIFGDLRWKKYQTSKNGKELVNYRKLNILSNFLVGTIDDVFYGNYNGLNFSILEFNSSITNSNFITLFMSLGLLLPQILGCGCMLFMLLFIIGIFLFGNLGFWGPFILPGGVLGIVIYNLIRMVPFQGVLVEFEMKKNFEGHTFLVEKAPTNRGISIDYSKFQEVKLEDTEFCKKYKVYSNNQVEARYVLTTAFIERFKNMKTAFKAKYIRAAFKDGKITIAIHAGRDLFAMANLNKDADCETFKELFDEILSVLELSEELKLNQNLGL